MNTDQAGPRLVIIGIDGATFNIIKPLLANNALPFFKKLMHRGCYGNLDSISPLNAAAAWTSYFSGKNPGSHNIFDYFTNPGATMQPELISNRSIQSRLLWHFVGDANKQSILVNIPTHSAPEPIHGIMSSGILTSAKTPCFYPDHVMRDIQYQDYSTDSGFARTLDADAYFNQILKTQTSQENSFRKLILNNPWTLAAITFNGVDRAQSRFWNDSEKVNSLYIHIDSFLENIHRLVGDETYFLVVSNYGYKSITKKFFVNEWLWELKLLQKRITTNRTRITHLDDFLYGATQQKMNPITKVLAATKITKGNIRRILPDAVSELLKKATSWSLRTLFPYEYLDIVWDKTRAYLVSTNTQGINLNVRGREPFGIVNPGYEYEQLRDQIIAELYRLRDPYTLENVIDEVYRKEDLFHGEFTASAPDIIFKPHNFDYYLSPEKRTSRLFIGSANDDYPIHAHTDPNGVFFLKGPRIRQSENLGNVSIYDMLPTILYSLGISHHENLDGNILYQAFEGGVGEQLTAHPRFIPFEDSLPFFPDEYFRKRFSLNATPN
ncbi:MAG: alkaline phosphatase family protein [Candidatus Zhuqueibacterota bacterium]